MYVRQCGAYKIDSHFLHLTILPAGRTVRTLPDYLTSSARGARRVSRQVVEPVVSRNESCDLLTVDFQELLRSGGELESPFVPEAITPSRHLGSHGLPRFLRNRDDLRSLRVGNNLRVSFWRCARCARLWSLLGGSTPSGIGHERSILLSLIHI